MDFSVKVTDSNLEWCVVCGRRGPGIIEFKAGPGVKHFCKDCYRKIRSFMYILPETEPKMSIPICEEALRK